MNVANALSLARLCSAPLVVWLIVTDELTLAFWIFLGASFSDAADGFIAKRLGSLSVLGRYLDPIADKVLLVGVFIALGDYDEAGDRLPLWLVFLVVFRDMSIVGGAVLFRLLTRTLSMDHGDEVRQVLGFHHRLADTQKLAGLSHAELKAGRLAAGEFAQAYHEVQQPLGRGECSVIRW